jgi:hypothetical protein
MRCPVFATSAEWTNQAGRPGRIGEGRQFIELNATTFTAETAEFAKNDISTQ